MMIMSFFEAIDVLPYVESANIIYDGHVIELTQEEQSDLLENVNTMFEKSRTMPAFGVVFDDMYREIVQDGHFISLKFPQIIEVNGLPFDELVFKVEPESQGFNLMRGMKGIFQGRCIYIDLQDITMNDLYQKIINLDSVKNFDLNQIPEQTIQENENEKFENVENDENIEQNLEENTETLSDIAETKDMLNDGNKA
ncbi:MAG: hypothetical protein ACI4R8_05045 [Candidatus Caccovivens sp.]